MPRGTRRTSYVRDNRGRFASTPGGGGASKRPPAKRVSRGTNRLTRDNSGRITSVGGNGATARGGRLRTGAGNLRARQTDRLKGAPQGVLSRAGKVRGRVAASTPRPVTRQRAKPPIGTPRKGQVARALARAEANMQRGSAAVDKAQGRNNRNISRASAEAGILQLSKPGSAEARKAKAAYDRLEKKIKKGEKTRTAAYNAKQRLGALEYAMTRGYGPTVAKARVRAGGNRSLLEPAPGDRIKGGRQRGTIAKPRGMKPGALAAKRQKPTGKVDMKQAISRAKELRQQANKLKAQGEALMGGGRRDGATVNMPLSSRGRRSAIDQGVKGAQLVARAATLNNRADRVLDRAVASRKKAEREAAKPAKAPRSAQSLRVSRAKQVEKRRSINISNPAGNRAEAAGRMAANAARTQQRALAFYGGKAKKKAVASNATVVTAAKSIKPVAGKAPRRISYLLAYHGTNKESATAIRAGGYKETRFGTYGDGVYATTSRKAAREYANWRAAGGKNKFGEVFPASALGPAVLAHRIPKGRINKGDLPGYMISDWVKSGKARKVSKRATGHSPYVVMNEQLANRTLVNRSGTIRRSGKPRRPKP